MPFYVGNVMSAAQECTGIGEVDPSFIDPGFDGSVIEIIVQPDLKILAGGQFNNVATSTTARALCRLNADGTVDTSFTLRSTTNINGNVLAIALQSDGKIIIGGGFTTIDTVTVNRIARLNSDGTRDTTFNTGSNIGANGSCSSLAIQPDGKILVGGAFTTMRGVTQNGIARLNTDGSLDTTFNTGANPGTSLTGGGAAQGPRKIIVQPDGKILIGGDFASVRGVTQNGFARLETDGSLDTTFNTGTNPGVGGGTGVRDMILLDDGKIIIGGAWNALRGTLLQNISRDIGKLNADGTRDTSWPNPSNTDATTDIYALELQFDDKIFVGGLFNTMKGATVNDYCRLKSDGTLDTTYNVSPPTPGLTLPTGLGSFLNCSALQDDCQILIGGAFTQVRGTTRHYMARLI